MFSRCTEFLLVGTSETLALAGVVKATLQSINGRLPASGQFKDISYQLNGLNLFARGNVVNGVPIINSIHDGKVYK